MTPHDWEQVKSAFEALLALPAAERRAWLERARQGADGLEAEVASLLDAHERAGAFLDTASADEPGPGLDEQWLGFRLGPYLLERVLGRGGMGIVYLARRESPTREVAIKVLAAPGSELVQRFGAESQILARLDHPNVARLFDVGQGPDGRPYFVMELVHGVPVDRHCAAGRLELRARLELFLKVCEAVSYAHGRLVVHRDIKPGNVLVDPSGQPKLLDFGIARLLDEQPSGLTTETGLRLMTPEFASPEQVRGEPATVATDVHALGLLLYLLLTGRSPFRLRAPSPAELVRVVCMDDAPAPSGVTGPRPKSESAAGFTPVEPPARLARLLRGDLDAIVARALRKEPQHRYASVAQLAEDVRAHLQGRPVQARDGRWRYRLGKFVRRNRLPVALAAALLFALVGGLIATAWQARVAQAERARAEKRLADVRRLATSFLFEFHDAVAQLPGSTKARELVVGKALEYLDGLAQEAQGDPQLQIELAQAYQRVGKVQGVPNQPNLGDVPGARKSLERAFALLAPVPGREPDPLAAAVRLGVLVDLAGVRTTAGEHDGALDLLQRATGALAPGSWANGDLDDALLQVAAFRALASELHRRGDLAGAEDAARAALALARDVRTRWPHELASLRRLGSAHQRLAAIQVERGKFDEARANARAGLVAARAGRRPDDTGSVRLVVAPLLALAEVDASTGDVAAASASYAEALEVSERMIAEDPSNDQARRDVGAILGLWCAQLNLAGLPEGPRGVCSQAARMAENGNDPTNATGVFNVAMGRVQLAGQRELQGDLQGALRLHARALEALAAPVLAGGGFETEQNRGFVLAATARVRLALGQARAAQEAAREALLALGALPPGRQARLDDLALRVQVHATLARAEGRVRGPAGRATCGPVVDGTPAAEALRALAPPAGHLAATLADFDTLRQACPA